MIIFVILNGFLFFVIKIILIRIEYNSEYEIIFVNEFMI